MFCLRRRGLEERMFCLRSRGLDEMEIQQKDVDRHTGLEHKVKLLSRTKNTQ